MFEFKYIELMNWAFWPSIKLPLDQRTIMITGPNGSGKTTFLDALRTLLRVPRLSANRRYTDYLNSDVETSVIKAVISNNVNGNGPRPFEFLGHSNDVITLAVLMRRKSGGWEKRFTIRDGDCSLESIRKVKISDFISPATYTHIIHEAGCSESLLKVLALEQGQTDKLCEKSPRELLDLLLDVHGDKEIIDRYKNAKMNYRSAHLEFSQLGARLAEEEAKLLVNKRTADDYKRYQNLKNDLARFEDILIPQGEYKAAKQAIHMAKLAIKDAGLRLSPIEHEVLRIQEKCNNVDADLATLKQNVVNARELKEGLEKEERGLDIGLNNLVLERKQIENLLADIADTAPVPIRPLEKQLEEGRRILIKADLQREDYRQLLQQCGQELQSMQVTKQKIYPAYVSKFIDILKKNEIGFRLLCDIIEITDDHWQLAIESVLGRDRFTIIVDKNAQLSARKFAEEYRYRGYIVSPAEPKDVAKKKPAAKKTAIDCVTFLDSGIPPWIIDILKRTHLVEEVKDGMGLDVHQSSVTRNGYRQDKRGGISIAVEHFYCGSLGQSSQKKSLKHQISFHKSRLAKVEGALIDHRRHERELAKKIEIQQGLLAAESAVKRKKFLDEEITAVNRKHKQALVAKRQAELTLLEALGQLNRFERDHDEDRRWLSAKLENQSVLVSEIKEYQETISELTDRQRQIEAQLDGSLLTDRALADVADIDELTPKYYAAKKLLEDYTEIPDESTVQIYENHLLQFEEQQRMYHDHQTGLVNWENEFNLARSKYFGVVDHTVREYKKNICGLSELAGVRAEISSPCFSENGDGLDDAELRVRFGFDGKHAIDINGNSHSGGQRVVASLILLMSMATTGKINRSGFFIIDEPFAHLSIERIDDISQFLEKSQCQFILTSPTTHNVNVFSAARLQLNFRIKKPQTDFAPVPTIIRR